MKPRYSYYIIYRGQYFKDDTKCYKCGEKGHIERECKSSKSRSRSKSGSKQRKRSRSRSISDSKYIYIYNY